MFITCHMCMHLHTYVHVHAQDLEENMALCPHIISTPSAFSLEEKDLQRLKELDR